LCPLLSTKRHIPFCARHYALTRVFSLSESMSACASQDLVACNTPEPSGNLIAPSVDRLSELWNQAVERYKTTLSKKEKSIFERIKSPEDTFQQANGRWQRTVVDRRSPSHEKVHQVVGNVLDLIGAVNSMLGMASSVCFQAR
jgi:hypothetical protein